MKKNYKIYFLLLLAYSSVVTGSTIAKVSSKSEQSADMTLQQNVMTPSVHASLNYTFENRFSTTQASLTKRYSNRDHEIAKLRLSQAKHHLRQSQSYQSMNMPRMARHELELAKRILELPVRHRLPGFYKVD